LRAVTARSKTIAGFLQDKDWHTLFAASIKLLFSTAE